MASASILPEDLILEILSWLPVISLMRFRCVSQTWYFLISHPYLVKLHLQRSSRDTQVLLKLKDLHGVTCTLASLCSTSYLIENPASSFEDSPQFRYVPVNFFLGSCNGLLCLHNSLYLNECEEHWVCFWNPATSIMSTPSPCLRLSFPIYLTQSYCVKWGFGYDDRSDTYKVVVMILDTKTLKMNVRVYCMGDTCWKNISTCHSYYTFEQVGTSLSGTVNWIGLSPACDDRKETFGDVELLEILSYDLRTDTSRYILVPGCTFEPSSEPRLGVLNGGLCVSLDYERTHLVILLLKEVRDLTSWTRLLNIRYENLHVSSSLTADVVILYMSGDILLLANYEDCEFILFNLKANKVERTESFKKPEFHIMLFDYVPSLLLPY